MYFKKLELFGFKSFVDKTTLIFEPGVTAIVGPNGTGKSNISDSIKWVLGEQSAKSMRGAKMEDVIFNGTEDRPAVNMCEVSLTLSNESRMLPIDYDEVTITRRLFRSGESEYLLNKTLVRLKDINELLMGTGIGTESYSLLEQGKIDAILSSKPEERRIIFEEASGITRYKKKKDEALRKLKATEENLLRVNDIIIEVNRQLGSIARQVNKARRYQEMFEELKKLDTQYSWRLFRELNNQRDQINEKEQALNSEEQELSTLLENLQEAFSALKTTLSEVEESYRELNGKAINISTQLEKNSDRIALNQERIEEFLQRIETGRLDMETAGRKISELEEQLEQLKSKMRVFEEEKSAKEHNLNTKQQSIAEIENLIRLTQENVEKSRLAAVNLMAEHAQLKNELAKLSANINHANARLSRLHQEKEKTLRELEEVNSRLQEKYSELEQLNNKVAGDQTRADQLQIENKDLQSQIRELDKVIQKLRQTLIAKQSEYNMLEKLSREYEGFSSNVKTLMLKRNDHPEVFEGVYDVLVNLIEVEPGFELSAETALGDYMQAVVVDNCGVALRMRQFLGEQGIGRVKILAMDAVPENSKGGFSVAGTRKMSDVIRSEEKFNSLIAYILEDTFLVTEESMKRLPLNPVTSREDYRQTNLFRYPARFVTAEGEMYSPAQLTSKPVPEQGLGLIAQKAQIRQLKEECQNIEQQVETLFVDENGKKEQLSRIETELLELTEALHKEKIVLANKNSEKANVEETKVKLDEELSVVNLEIDETALDEKELLEKEAEKKNRLQELDLQAKQNEEEMARGQEVISVKTQEREELLVVVAELKTEFSLLTEQEATFNANLSMLSQGLMEQRNNLEYFTRQKEESEQKIGELREQVNNLQESNKGLEQEKTATESALNEIREKRTNLIGEFESIQNRIKEKENRVNAVRNEVRDLDVKKVELNFKIDGLTNNVRQAYKVEICELNPEIPEDVNWDQQKEQIDMLKGKIDRIGAVNLAAVEEEEELRQRSDFLNSQREDLFSAKQSLMHAISKINKTTRSLFLETFEKSKVLFKEYFKLLFGGGDAQLHLSEEKDILESGIDIVVRPPGKKLQNLSLLSGGEKTLTAIALLFAIFKIKPTPFCVLDEMDAPLDESNIDRFTRVLQEFLKNSQFIIITHNKKTIGMADVMYGVTMQQAGVSRLVSVKFSDFKDDGSVTQSAQTIQPEEGEPAEIPEDEISEPHAVVH